jgi:hypothetical protein
MLNEQQSKNVADIELTYPISSSEAYTSIPLSGLPGGQNYWIGLISQQNILDIKQIYKQ